MRNFEDRYSNSGLNFKLILCVIVFIACCTMVVQWATDMYNTHKQGVKDSFKEMFGEHPVDGYYEAGEKFGMSVEAKIRFQDSNAAMVEVFALFQVTERTEKILMNDVKQYMNSVMKSAARIAFMKHNAVDWIDSEEARNEINQKFHDRMIKVAPEMGNIIVSVTAIENVTMKQKAIADANADINKLKDGKGNE